MSPLITWHGAGTASLQSGILTEWSWNWWRCAAAVNCGYRLVREGGRREEGGRNVTELTEHGEPEWGWKFIKRQTSFYPHLCLFYFTSSLHSIPWSSQRASFLFCFTVFPMNMHIGDLLSQAFCITKAS